jgi:ferredoxin-NADP reductase
MLWYRHRFTVERIVQETPDAWSVYITGRRMDAFRFEPGQFANLHLLSRGLWAGHPFSFSQEYDGRTLRFTIKELGDDTGLIRHLKPGVKVIVDGPLGVFTPDRAKTGKYLLIAGGIGVTPIRAIAGALASAGADEVVLYAARTRAHTALLGEMADRVRKMFVLLSQDAGPLPPGFLQGTIDARAIRSLVPDAAQRDVYICGPAAMMRAVTSALREVGVPARQIHSERFAY